MSTVQAPPLIEDPNKLVRFFESYTSSTPRQQRIIEQGVIISDKVRCDFLVSGYQGCVTINGHRRTVQFINMTGVWRAMVNFSETS